MPEERSQEEIEVGSMLGILASSKHGDAHEYPVEELLGKGLVYEEKGTYMGVVTEILPESVQLDNRDLYIKNMGLMLYRVVEPREREEETK